ncbi:MAG: hypothetical protein ACRDRW_10770 [Pseudonocardiaceae bacterium]
MTNTTTDLPKHPTDNRRRVIHASCSARDVARGFRNLVVSERDGEIQLDPHVNGFCALTLAEDEAIALRDALSEWLG